MGLELSIVMPCLNEANTVAALRPQGARLSKARQYRWRGTHRGQWLVRWLPSACGGGRRTSGECARTWIWRCVARGH